MTKRFAFGIDLAGYATGDTASAEAWTDRAGEALIRVIKGCPLSFPRHGDVDVKEAVEDELPFLEAMLDKGAVAIDIPIDLQRLGEPVDRQKLWELTRRPIDRVLDAMPPLADRIGAPVARFRNIMRLGNFDHALGSNLFETYPAATLRNLRIQGANTSERRIQFAASWSGIEGLSEHEIDAAICALTALALPPARLEKASLTAALELQFEGKSPHRRSIPEGFILLGSNPFSHVAIERIDLSEWH